MTFVRIPFLKDKLQSIRESIPVLSRYRRANLTVQQFVWSLYHASGRLQGDESNDSSLPSLIRTWNRHLLEARLPPDLVAGLRIMYPRLTLQMLKAETLEEFGVLLAAQSSAFDRYRLVLNYYSRRRVELDRVMRPYYAELDSDPTFPLLTQAGWIPDEPILLDEQRERSLLRFVDCRSPPGPPFLDGLPEGFHELRILCNPEVKLENDECYRPTEISMGKDGLQLDFGRGYYFDFLDSCEVLGLELARWVQVHNGRVPPANPGDLPLRGHPISILDLRNRSAVAGVTTLLMVLGHGPGDIFFWQERGTKVAVNQNLDSLVPSGTFQPFLKHDGVFPRDFQITRTVLREFGEELLGKKEFELLVKQNLDLGGIDELRPFIHLLQNDRAHIHFLGIGLDRVTTVPEILTAFVFRSQDLPPATVAKFRANFEGSLGFSELTPIALNHFSERAKVFPASAACAKLAAKHFHHLVNFGARSSRRARSH